MSHWFRALLAISYPLLGFVFSPEAWAVGEPVQYDPAKTKNIHDLYERTAVLGDSWIKAIDSRLGAPIFHKNFAVVIGVGDYDYWNHLEAPPYDAVRMRNFLVEQGYDSVLLLTNREASKANIEQYMEDKLPGLVQDNDRVLFYFSGHGTQRALKGRVRGYLPMLNSKPDEYSSMISMEDIERWEQNLRDARHLLFVLDACFSGLAGVEVKGGFPKPATQSLYLAQLKTVYERVYRRRAREGGCRDR